MVRSTDTTAVHLVDRPGVSVVVPTHNRRDLLEETLDSVFEQRGVFVEVIVVDDGSSDDTSTFLASVPDPRLRTIVHENSLGVATARNTGLRAASKPWVAFIDDDDLWAPEKLATQVSAMERSGDARWPCSAAIIINEHRLPIRHQPPLARRDLAEVLLARNVIPGGASGVVAATDLAREVGGFDPRFSVLADWDFWIRLGLASPVATVSRVLHAYRIHPDGMSITTDVGPELRLIEDKYVSERQARGVVFDRPAMTVWVGDRQQRAGLRLPAAESYLRSVPRISRAKAALKAAEVLLWPKLYRSRDFLNGRRARRSVRADVSRWLDRPVEPGA